MAVEPDGNRRICWFSETISRVAGDSCAITARVAAQSVTTDNSVQAAGQQERQPTELREQLPHIGMNNGFLGILSGGQFLCF
jgi:hypothetical protein